MSVNLTEGNNNNIIDKVFDFAILHPGFFLLYIIVIILAIILISKGYIRIFGKHQDSGRDSYMDVDFNKNKEK